MMFSNPWIIQLIGLELMLLLAFVVFVKLHNRYKNTGIVGRPSERLIAEFERPIIWMLVAGYGGIAALGYGWYWIIYELLEGYFSSFTGYVFLERIPVQEFSVLIGGLLGLGNAIILSNSIGIARWKEEYATYIWMIQNRYSQMADVYGMGIAAAGFVIIGAIPVTMVLVDTYAVFSSRQIIINPVDEWSERIYNYTDVKSLKCVQYRIENNRKIYDPYYVIDFEDGYKWEPSLEGQGIIRGKEEIMNYVAGQSGKTLQFQVLDQ